MRPSSAVNNASKLDNPSSNHLPARVDQTGAELKRGEFLNTIGMIAPNFRSIFIILVARYLGPVLVTHNPLIAEACDWIHEMKDGRIIASHPRDARHS